MSALNTTGQTITVIAGGTSVPLPDDQTLSGFTVNGTNTVFTVPTTGTYLVTYHIRTTVALLLTSSILRNGTTLAGSSISPIADINSYNMTLITDLAAGDTLQLRLSGLVATVVLQGGTGASLTVVRLA